MVTQEFQIDSYFFQSKYVSNTASLSLPLCEPFINMSFIISLNFSVLLLCLFYLPRNIFTCFTRSVVTSSIYFLYLAILFLKILCENFINEALSPEITRSTPSQNGPRTVCGVPELVLMCSHVMEQHSSQGSNTCLVKGSKSQLRDHNCKNILS